MRLAFLGTPQFAVPTLAALREAGHRIAMVYSQPPAQRGRGRRVTPSAVQAFAESTGLPTRTPVSLREAGEADFFESLALEAAVVVAFGQILPVQVLGAPRLGSFNLHASLLPRWRGAAPIQRAIMAGDLRSGVAVMRMTEGLDEGPVLAQTEILIEPAETSGSLQDKLSLAGAPLMVATLRAVERDAARESPQSPNGVTYARKIRPKEARIGWENPAEEVDRAIRGLSPMPGAWFAAPTGRGPVRVRALLSRVEAVAGAPGEVIDEGFLVACGAGAVRILRAQREGREPQPAAQFLRGFPLPPGVRLD